MTSSVGSLLCVVAATHVLRREGRRPPQALADDWGAVWPLLARTAAECGACCSCGRRSGSAARGLERSQGAEVEGEPAE
jgi:hypothetical protein